ncbi:MAG: anhydro-N-acetylmuramic acid kinase, partial [Hyphomicrobiales bacterium]
KIVTDVHIRVLKEQIRASEMPVDHVGLHGQTIFHDPARKLTIQIGDAQRIADELGLPVVHDLRQNDVIQGGEGAPLAPIFHAALIAALKADKPAVFLNIGGVANVTYVAEDGELLAFDTGPGNALLDDFMQAQFGLRMDLDGAVAGRGRILSEIGDRLMSHPFFERKPPKSLDRREFHDFAMSALGNSAAEDSMATLTAFTADAIHRAQRWYPVRPQTILVSGGGVKNPVMMELLQALTPIKLQIASDLGWDDVFIEANAFAYLAARHLRQLPISFPGTTSVPEPMTGGEIAYPKGS